MEPDDILFGGAETYEEKNDDYGDSWRKIGTIMHMLANGQPITLETPEDHISYGLFTRRMDKIARAFNGEFCADDMNFESVKDAHEDEMVYAAMHASNQNDRTPDIPDLDSIVSETSIQTPAFKNANVSYDSGTFTAGDSSDGPIRFTYPRDDGRNRCTCCSDRDKDSGE